jgi:subtilisin-like proprotein convertase family protein
VEAAGNIFFDISDVNFSITPAANIPVVTLDSTSLTGENCGVGNGAIDPDETVSVSFALKNIGTLSTTNLVVTLLAGNGVVSPSAAQTYGALAANGPAVSRTFSFTASGSCGGTISPVLQLQDGTNNMGTLSVTFPLGEVTISSTTNSNTTSISIPNSGKANHYPSTITVSGVSGTVTKATVSLLNFSHTYPDDLEILLVGPDSQSTMLMARAGGGTSISGVNLTFDDSASSAVPQSSSISSGTYLPSDYSGGSSLVSPAPAAPYGGPGMSVFNGGNPNGTWSLYILDIANPDRGSVAGGWKLTLSTSVTNCCENVNHAPVLSAISNRTVYAGIPLVFTNSASDADPLDVLSFSFVTSASGAQLNPTNGIFNWTPATNQSGTNHFSIQVTDNGSPNLSDTKNFYVLVALAPSIQNVTENDGQVTLTWNAIANHVYRIQYKNDLNDADWIDLPGDVTADSTTASKTDSSASGAERFYRILVLN